MSTSRRVQHDKRRLDNLKKESVKLNRDVEHLQDALLLHQRFQEEEDTTIKGMIRKEIGGSIWQHGGAGKLRTYKSTKDLSDPYGIGTPKSKTKESSGTKVTRMVSSDGNETNDFKHSGLHGSSKPSNKNSSYKHVGNNNETVSYLSDGSTSKDIDKFKVKALVGRDVSPRNESPGNTTEENDQSRTIGNYDWQKMETLKTKVIKKASANVITRKRSAVKSKDKIPENKKALSENSLSNTSGRVRSAPVRARRENSRERKIESVKVEKVLKENKKQQTIHETRVPRNSIEVESNESQKESHRLSSPRFPKQTNRIFVDDADSGSKSPLETSYQTIPHNNDQQNVFHSPNTSPKQVPKCDPDVHLWLRRLGLLEEEKYVQIFAKNEIDMEELLLLSPEHLNSLGVVAVGAFNKIVRGIQELQQKSSPTGEVLSSKSNKTGSHWETSTTDHCPSVSENDWDPNQDDPPQRTSSSLWQNTPMQVPKRIADGAKMLNTRNPNSQDHISDKMSSHSSEPNHFDKMILFEHDLHNEKSKPVQVEESKKDTKKLDINGNTRILSRCNSFSSRTSTSKPPIKREQERTSRKDTEKKSDKTKSVQSKLQPRPRSRSLSRRGSVSKTDGKTNIVTEKTKQKTPNQQDGVSSDTGGQQKKHAAVIAAARRLEDRQKMEKDYEEKEQKSRERRKQQRDELAAKHLSRERSRRTDEEVVDTMANIQQWASDVTNHTLADLLTVSVLDTGSHTDEPESMGVTNPTVLKENGSGPSYSRRAPKVSNRQSLALPLSTSDITKNDPNKFLVSSSLRISSRPPKHNTTKQGSSNAVRDLEQQIQSLQERAMSGELITMDLVRDLQNRLFQVENQVTSHKFEQSTKSLGKISSNAVTNSTVGKDHLIRLNLDDNLTRLNLDSDEGF
ncbi:uncharacterized protein LOC117329337 [Pecten maximus]|uniref:uncharacterized protein LOC117329337 n=1 Tax=Pecten maximus TaxID=6579 RepID=UPI001458F3BE|nr:uncharacterized protein LOC117329337 [Pecten maximus]